MDNEVKLSKVRQFQDAVDMRAHAGVGSVHLDRVDRVGKTFMTIEFSQSEACSKTTDLSRALTGFVVFKSLRVQEVLQIATVRFSDMT